MKAISTLERDNSRAVAASRRGSKATEYGLAEYEPMPHQASDGKRAGPKSSGARASSSSEVVIRPTAPSPEVMRDIVLASLDDDRATDVVSIDLAGRSAIADFMIIANGASTRQVAAMAQHLQEKLGKAGVRQIRTEGMPQCDWVIIDAGDVVVNLFRPDVRDFYQLDKMWVEPMPEPGRTLSLV